MVSGGPRTAFVRFSIVVLVVPGWSPGGPRVVPASFPMVFSSFLSGPRVVPASFPMVFLSFLSGPRVVPASFPMVFSSFLSGPRVVPVSFPMVFSSFLSGPRVVPAFFPVVVSRCVQGNRALGCRLGTSDFFPHLHYRSVFIDIRTSIAVAVGLLAPLISVQHEGPFLDP
jgi:hypothetical protein